MTARLRSLSAVALLAVVTVYFWPEAPARAQTNQPGRLIVGRVIDNQIQAISGAMVSVRGNPQAEPLAETTTQPDGSFTLSLGGPLPPDLWLEIERPHFQTRRVALSASELQQLQEAGTLSLPTLTLDRLISVAFWVAILIFVGMLALIALGTLHNTLAALAGAVLIFSISYLGSTIDEHLFIFEFRNALGYVDWNVIFLIMGMMIVIAVVERTGIFQWLAFFAYRVSGGRIWLLMAILMVLTGVASALLDNVTTMLLMTPISIQIALSLGINPLTLLMPEVMASNVAGISTLIGTPTNILIGSFGEISFNDFLNNLTPGVLLSLVALFFYCQWIFRKDVRSGGEISETLLAKLAERATITQPGHLKKAGVVGLGMLLLFVLGERFHLLPAVTALMGATALLLWIRPDIEEMLQAVDWTTLVFFISLFIVVGAVQEVGFISLIADGIGNLVGENLPLAMLAITVLSAVLSTVIANIPFTAAMLPVIGFLTATIPGAESKVLFFCLSVGSAMGGNGSLIGASANMVTSGISERAGFPITYQYFLRKGFPAMLITVGLALVWLFIRF